MSRQVGRGFRRDQSSPVRAPAGRLRRAVAGVTRKLLASRRAGATIEAMEPRVVLSAGGIVVSEIMYHAASNNVLDEWVELYNPGTATVNLNGWKFTKGIEFTFGNTPLGAGQYLVVAHD